MQYAAVQNAAMEQRRAVNQAQTKLSTDTARQISDLRSQGEFEKADALLELNQAYLVKLMELQQWNAEYSMQKAQVEESIRQWEAGYQLDLAQFEENIRQWQASFQESIRQWEAEYLESIRQWEAEFGLEVDKFNAGQSQWEAEFGLSEGSLTGNYKGSATLDSQKLQNSVLVESGWTMLKNGIMPSSYQLTAMGISSAQAQEYLTALQSVQSGNNSSSAGKTEDEGDPEIDTSSLAGLFDDMYTKGITDFSGAEYYLLQAGVKTQDDRKNWADDYIAKLRAGELEKRYVETTYGPEYENALSQAMERRKAGASYSEIREALVKIYPLEFLTEEGLEKIMDMLQSY